MSGLVNITFPRGSLDLHIHIHTVQGSQSTNEIWLLINLVCTLVSMLHFEVTNALNVRPTIANEQLINVII